MNEITHTTFALMLPNGKQLDFTGDATEAEIIDVAFKDAECWRKALSAYERGVLISHDNRTGEIDGYVSLFLQAIRERHAQRLDVGE